MPRLVSVNVGVPKDVAWHSQVVRTAIWKHPVQGRRLVRRINIDGDDQADRNGHGGEHRAVFVYQIECYDYWQKYLHRDDFVLGQFGENFTVQGLADDEVCVGDRYRIGSALFEVTQPRVTCFRLGIRMDEPRMPALVVAHHRPGFYLRVLQEGDVGAGDDIVRVETGPGRMTVADVDAMLYLGQHSSEQLRRALEIPALSDGWRGSFRALLEQVDSDAGTGNAGLTGAIPAPAWSGFRELRVAKIQMESTSVKSFVLEAPDSDPLPRPLAGQSIAVRLQPDTSGTPFLRSYSLSGPQAVSAYRIGVKLEPHGLASTFLHSRTRVGDVWEVAAPRGSFVLDVESIQRPVVLLSAGIGLTPVLAMLHALALVAPSREVWWLYGARNSSEHPFAAEVRALLSRLPNAHVWVCYSQPNADDQPGQHFDRLGRLTPDVLDAVGTPMEADFYVCGPEAFMRDHVQGLRSRQVGRDRIHVELFGPEPSITPGIAERPMRRPHQPEGANAMTGPIVAFARSSVTTRWSPTYASLLELAEACDVPVRWSCRTGVCHTCESRLLEGRVSYSPDPLDPPGDGDVLVCSAQPTADVVLDL
jgi:ferredoxin-NADP reductase/MOSC domain-containing protein YiiM